MGLSLDEYKAYDAAIALSYRHEMQAKTLLKHYLFNFQGKTPSMDNRVEVSSIVDEIIKAAVSSVKAELIKAK